jgi:hypothetical protein
MLLHVIPTALSVDHTSYLHAARKRSGMIKEVENGAIFPLSHFDHLWRVNLASNGRWL